MPTLLSNRPWVNRLKLMNQAPFVGVMAQCVEDGDYTLGLIAHDESGPTLLSKVEVENARSLYAQLDRTTLPECVTDTENITLPNDPQAVVPGLYAVLMYGRVDSAALLQGFGLWHHTPTPGLFPVGTSLELTGANFEQSPAGWPLTSLGPDYYPCRVATSDGSRTFLPVLRSSAWHDLPFQISVNVAVRTPQKARVFRPESALMSSSFPGLRMVDLSDFAEVADPLQVHYALPDDPTSAMTHYEHTWNPNVALTLPCNVDLTGLSSNGQEEISANLSLGLSAGGTLNLEWTTP